MHKTIKLGLSHAEEGNVYFETGGNRVLYVHTDIHEGKVADALRIELAKRGGRNGEYDFAILYTADSHL
jgi:hypothetical protein